MSVQLPKQTSPSVSVVEAVAARKGVEPTDLDIPLFQAIDPDALDTLVERFATQDGDAMLRIEFTYDEYDVVVGADGSVSLSEVA